MALTLERLVSVGDLECLGVGGVDFWRVGLVDGGFLLVGVVGVVVYSSRWVEYVDGFVVLKIRGPEWGLSMGG